MAEPNSSSVNITHVLIVDDDAELRTLVGDYLRGYGMRVTAVADGSALHRALPDASLDVVLLDIMLPDGNGLDLCRWLRKASRLPVIMLTAQGDPASRVIGLEVGADDYLPKPFEPRELVARINAVLRRSNPRGSASTAGCENSLRFNGWRFDRLGRELRSPEQVAVMLSATEFRLLCAFVDHPKRVLSRERLLELTRTPGSEVTPRAVDIAVSRLRQKLADTGRKGELIRTLRGEGYLFDADIEGSA